MDEGKIRSNKSKDMKIDEVMRNQPFDFARIVRVMVMWLAIVVACIVVYITSCNNFGQFQLPSTSITFFSSSSTSYELIYDDLVHDEYYDLRKVLKAASMPDKTVILTSLNKAWLEPNSIFDLFLESFKIGNDTVRLLNHLLVITVDEEAYSKCLTIVSHCYYFKSNKSSEKAHEARFMSPVYLEMMWERQELLQTILSLGHNFVFTDTDVMWFRNPFPYFYPDADFQTSCDVFNGNPSDVNNFPNNGFNFVRSNNRTIEFYKFWVLSRWRYPGVHEQNVFNKIKRDPFIKQINLTLRFLDTDYFGGFCTPSRDLNKVCTMHANCCVGLNRKIVDLRIMLDDWKRFVALGSNQTTSQRPYYWRVPRSCRRRHMKL